jgi:hypothetical protein
MKALLATPELEVGLVASYCYLSPLVPVHLSYYLKSLGVILEVEVAIPNKASVNSLPRLFDKYDN